ncbi:hypothetical protein HMPREF3051_10190 [Fusobacterium sp. HMSC064B11]|uniref:hypothetical protein n=1 Tax=Fusobacterium TaxID=848 RepID=UPI0008A2A292|nr:MULTISPECIES: hypothetical protein [Fusobacterium]MBS5186913.1 hypothetical protein [Fusobacterium nucleatum]OFO26953.1 hypothetical protein HMPREF3051_10190 [Fusobacterium sp. HMSC064B11]WDF25811.1 hypothetical protein PSC67_04755 [Fusobacterium nucleatum]
MLKKLSLIIFSIFLMACSNVVTVKETSEKKEVIRQVIITPQKEVILLGDNYDYLFKEKEARQVLIMVDFLGIESLKSKNISEIKKTIRASETGTMRFQASQEFRVYKKNKDDKDFEEKQKIFINNLKKELEEKNIKFDVKEDDREWRFYINYKMDAIGKVAKLENHDKVLQETSNKLMDLKVDLFISHTKEVRKKSFGESVGDFGESVKDGACEVFEVGVLCLTAPIWVPFVAVYTLIAVPALLIYDTRY